MSSTRAISNINFVNLVDDEIRDQESSTNEVSSSNPDRSENLSWIKSYSRELIIGLACVLLLLVLIIGVSIAVQPNASNSQSPKRDSDMKFKLSGSYLLHDVDDNFDDYLESLGISRFIALLIKQTKEMITVAEPTHINPNWTLTMTTEYSTHKIEFQLGTNFYQPGPGRSVITHLCERPEFHILVCTTQERTKNWNLRSRLIFSWESLIDEKTNLDKNISTNKTYLRIAKASEADQDISGLISDQTDPEPGSDKADDVFEVWE